jgi:hypothetical protein
VSQEAALKFDVLCLRSERQPSHRQALTCARANHQEADRIFDGAAEHWERQEYNQAEAKFKEVEAVSIVRGV